MSHASALQDKAARIAETLARLHPRPEIPLAHTDAYTLLVAVVLSAQCTDARVNEITPALFARARTPQAMSALPVEEIRALIRPCGLSPTKARHLRALSEQLMRVHGGEVPRDFAALEALPGVGHKTASVVMAQAFGVPAFPVDTHIHRLAQRWGLSNGASVERTERDLKALYPPAQWRELHLRMIYFGRAHCPARGHDPRQCPICSFAAPPAAAAVAGPSARTAAQPKAPAARPAAPTTRAAPVKRAVPSNLAVPAHARGSSARAARSSSKERSLEKPPEKVSPRAARRGP